MKLLLLLLCWLYPAIAMPQIIDSVAKEVSFIQKTDTSKTISIKAQIKPEILTYGFIDIVNKGQVNASAGFIQLMIGEADKFILLACPEKNV